MSNSIQMDWTIASGIVVNLVVQAKRVHFFQDPKQLVLGVAPVDDQGTEIPAQYQEIPLSEAAYQRFVDEVLPWMLDDLIGKSQAEVAKVAEAQALQAARKEGDPEVAIPKLSGPDFSQAVKVGVKLEGGGAVQGIK